MRYIFLSFLLIISLGCSNSTTTTVSPEAYLDEAFTIIEEHSIMRDSIDLDELKNKVYVQLEEIESIEDCYPIIQSILRDLGDKHSFFMPKSRVKKWENTSKESSIKEMITFSGKRLDHNIGYIHMKGFSSGDPSAIQQYADSLQQQIKAIDNENLIGWIIDLRENTGGNCWPMLAGIGPILGSGVCGYFINNQQEKSAWFYKDGTSGIDTIAITKVSMEAYELINDATPIAILTGERTASSGEVVVTAFHNKNNTRSFGESTRGLSTGNANYKLSDGSMVVLTSSIYADRNGTTFGNKIKPDEVIPFSKYEIGKSSDKVIERAKEWIMKY